MVGESEAHADLGGEFGRIIAGAEQPDRRQRRIVGHRHHVVVGMAGREIAGLPQGQFVQPLEEIVALAAFEPAAQRVGGGAVGARRAAEPEIDPAGKQRLQHLEPFGHHQRRVVGQHHAAGADPNISVTAAICPIIRSGAGLATERGYDVRPASSGHSRGLGMARQIDAVAQRRGRFGAGGDDGQVEDRKWNHARQQCCGPATRPYLCRSGPRRPVLPALRNLPVGQCCLSYLMGIPTHTVKPAERRLIPYEIT